MPPDVKSFAGCITVTPEMEESIGHMNAQQVRETGTDMRQWVAVLATRAARGDKLTPKQEEMFPYLRDLQRRIASEAEEIEATVVEATPRQGRAILESELRDQREQLKAETDPARRARLESFVRDRETELAKLRREAPERPPPEREEIFHFEGGTSFETKTRDVLAARKSKRERIMREIRVLEKELHLEHDPDPARRLRLERSLASAQADLKSVQEPPPYSGKGRPKPPPKGMVTVRGPDGKPMHVGAGQVFVDVPRQKLREGIPKTKLLPHPDGSDRHGMVHLESASVSIEPFGAPDPFYHDEAFLSVDPAKEWGRDIPFMVHQDGSLTMSVTPVSDYYVEKQAGFGHQPTFAPRDRVEYGMTRSRNTGERISREHKVLGYEKRSGNEVLGFPDEPPPAFGRFPTTYVQRRIRKDAQVQTYHRPDVPRQRLEPASAAWEEGMEGFESADFIQETDEVVMRVRQRKVRTAGRFGTPDRRSTGTHLEEEELRGFHLDPTLKGWGIDPDSKMLIRAPREGPAEYLLSKEALTSPNPHPEWATIRRVARILQKQGYDDSTRIRIRIARERHMGVPDAPTSMTIREAASLELPMPNSDKLFEEAAARGLRVLPRGKGTEIIFPGQGKHIYQDELEALEAVQRIPLNKVDVSLDTPLASHWNMGVENSFDTEIESRAFLPMPLQEAVVGQVVKGSRALMEVRTSDLSEFTNAFNVLAKDVTPGRTLAFHVLEPGKTNVRVAVYDPELVRARATTFSPYLQRLGVNTGKSAEGIIEDLDRVPNGLYIMTGSDPESAIIDSWYHQKNMRGNWQQGKVEVDETGPFRSYSPEVKKKFNFKTCPT